MAIAPATRRNLELTETLSGSRSGSLLAAIDRSVTAAGARELASRLAAPLTDVKAIAARHDAVELFFKDSELRRTLREALRAAPDLSRAIARLSVQRGGPRDLGNIRDAIKAARLLRDGLQKIPLAGEAVAAADAITQGFAAASALY